ncbi:hypothetical protein [Actinomadura bangladeshensis]|uniref:Uncharacterized protein n=1 Tax=Actinomadura bangladeshensis TaxID=453573 RepID=A0A6L9Q7Z9_9ACTN|nr:hypothetical protein [Actinomadura bangladeshensis]NEA21198.1 hypothetical protein [Actinomadura bangladeshensis]
MRQLRTWAAVVAAAALAVFGGTVPANADTAGGGGCRPQVADLELPAAKVHSGAAATGTVRLGCAAQRPLTVALTSADPAWATVPEQVVVPAGQAAAAFPIETHQPDYIYGDFGIAITAKTKGQEVTRSLALQPGLKFLEVSPSVISGDSVQIDFGLNGTAPAGGMAVHFSSDNAALTVPESITIPSGALGLAGGYGKTVRIPQDADVTITATLPGQTLTAVVSVKAWTYDPGDWSLTGSGSTYGGLAYKMSLNLPNPVPHGGVEVTFTTDDPKVPAPSPMMLGEGTSGSVTVDGGAGYDVSGEVTYTATIEGVGSRSHTVLFRPGLKAIEVPWVEGGRSFEGTVHLGAATTEPVTVKLSADNPALQVPAEVVIPAGASSATFSGTAAAVTDFEIVTLTAEMGPSRLEQSVYILPAAG